MELQTSFSYYPKEYLFLASSLERRVKNCPFMGRQLPKKSPEKAIWAWAGPAGAQAVGLGLASPWNKTVQQKLLQSFPGKCHLEKPETAWSVGVQDDAKWTGMKGKKREGEQWEKEILFTLYAGKIKPHCTGAGFPRMFCLRPWLSPGQFKSPVWYTVMPRSTSPVLPFFHKHSFLLDSCSSAQWWTNTANTPSVLLCQGNQLALQPRHWITLQPSV